MPSFDFCHDIDDLFEEVDLTGASDDQTFATKHDHLSEIFFYYFLKAKLMWLIGSDKKTFALSIKRIHFISGLGVKAGEWEISFVAIHSLFSTFAHNSSATDVPNEMIMRQFKIIKDINENFIVSDETTRDVWLWKAFVDHSEVVDS